MIAYVDASVTVRVVMEQPSALVEWPQIALGITSVVMRVECCRALDRLARTGEITDAEYDAKLAQIDRMLTDMIVLPVDPPVLHAASRRLGVRVDTLDAIHLATAELFRSTRSTEDAPLFATHDHTLAVAARSIGFHVIGSN